MQLRSINKKHNRHKPNQNAKPCSNPRCSSPGQLLAPAQGGGLGTSLEAAGAPWQLLGEASNVVVVVFLCFGSFFDVFWRCFCLEGSDEVGLGFLLLKMVGFVMCFFPFVSLHWCIWGFNWWLDWFLLWFSLKRFVQPTISHSTSSLVSSQS